MNGKEIKKKDVKKNKVLSDLRLWESPQESIHSQNAQKPKVKLQVSDINGYLLRRLHEVAFSTSGFKDSLRWNIPLTASGLPVVLGRFLLFQNILMPFHWFPGFETRVCVCMCSCLLCKPCSHHPSESLGMNREKGGSVCSSLLFFSSCFSLLRMSANCRVSRKQTRTVLLSSSAAAWN